MELDGKAGVVPNCPIFQVAANFGAVSEPSGKVNEHSCDFALF